jgi:hypothetical protein
MAERAPDDFAIAQEIFATVAESLADVRATVGEPTDLVVLLA